MSAFSAGEDWLAAILGQKNEERVNGPSPLRAIETRVWRLQRPDGTVRSDRVMLCGNGSIAGYKHANEAAWAPHGEGIAFLAADGRITSVAQDISQDDSGAWRIAMVHPFLQYKPAHLLIEQLQGAADVAAPDHSAAGQQNAHGDLIVGSEHFLQAPLQRAVLVANNRDIGAAWFEAVSFGPADLLVQFNQPFYFDRLRGVKCHKLHVFNAKMGRFWGFDDDGAPQKEFHAQDAQSLTFLFANNRPAPLTAYLEGLPADIHRTSFHPVQDMPDFFYPAGKWPSAGYAAVTFLRLVNELRRARGDGEISIKLVGFTGRYPAGGAWNGHDFAFEQAQYEAWEAAGLMERLERDDIGLTHI